MIVELSSMTNALGESRGEAREESRGKFKLYADTAHPINSKCRDEIEQKVLAAFKEETEKSKEPGYKSPVMDEPDTDDYGIVDNE